MAVIKENYRITILREMLLLLACVLFPAKGNQIARIVGGEPANRSSWSFLIWALNQKIVLFDPGSGIRDKIAPLKIRFKRHGCGASIVGYHWIVTAAHCVIFDDIIADGKLSKLRSDIRTIIFQPQI